MACVRVPEVLARACECETTRDVFQIVNCDVQSWIIRDGIFHRPHGEVTE